MSFWMASNGVTVPPLRSCFLAVLFFLMGEAVPAGAASAAVLTPFLKQNKNDATLKAPLTELVPGWSADFLLTASLEVEQKYLSARNGAYWRKTLQGLQQAYLKKVGWEGSDRDPKWLFKGLLNTADESMALARVYQSWPHEKRERSTLEVLADLYGAAKIVSGVLVVGSSDTEVLEKWVHQICPKHPCKFWNSSYISRVSLFPVHSVAHYVPELTVLRLSQGLLKQGSALAPVVFAHELAHIAQAQAEVRGEDWRKEFARFSGWERTASGWTTPVQPVAQDWNDVYHRDASLEGFTLLPDPVLFPLAGPAQKADGFVFAHAVRETIKTGDVAEDFADHIAAYIFAPSRFCFQGKPIAERKYAWVAQRVFGVKKTLNCAKGTGK